MKIAFVSTMSLEPWGGSEVLWSEAARRLVAAGHEVAIAFPWRPAQSASLRRLAEACGVEVFGHGAPRARWRRLARSVARAAGLPDRPTAEAAWLARERPDLLCISCGSAMDDTRWLELARDQDLPTAIIVQAETELWPDDAEANRRHALYQSARRCFFVAAANLRRQQRQWGRMLTNAEVVFNHAGDAGLQPPPWPRDDGVWRLACVGRLFPCAKGQDLIIDVLSLPHWRERPLEVHLFGSGPQEQTLRRLVEAAGLQRRVHFRGHVSGVATLWRECHALLLPSRIEGLPLVIQEAMLCARPCLVTDVSGNAELISHGETGYLAEAATARHLDAMLEEAWAGRTHWQDMGRRARAHALAVMPADPPQVLADKLLALTASSMRAEHPSCA